MAIYMLLIVGLLSPATSAAVFNDASSCVLAGQKIVEAWAEIIPASKGQVSFQCLRLAAEPEHGKEERF